MKWELALILFIVFLLWLTTWVVSHSYIIVSLAPVLAVLAFAFVMSCLYLKYRLGRKA